MQVASVISSGRSQFMVLGWIFQKGRLFSSLTLASSSDAQSEGAILQQFLTTCPRLAFFEDHGCLAVIQEQKWQFLMEEK